MQLPVPSRALMALVAGLLLAAASPVAAQNNPLLGTWELDRFNSVYEPIAIAPTRQTMEIRSTGTGDQFSTATTTWRIVNNGGEVASETTYTAALDGKDYPTSAPRATVAFRRTGANTIERTAKLFDQVAETAVWTISGNGNVLTIKRSGADAQGVKYSATQIYKKVR